MRGITEAELWMHRNNDRLDWDTRRAFDIVMRTCPPKELTPWLPIADAPLGKRLRLYNGETQIEGRLYEDIDRKCFTHYQELPADPK